MDKRLIVIKKENKKLKELADSLVSMCKEKDPKYKSLNEK